jgi:hypothetical protein
VSKEVGSRDEFERLAIGGLLFAMVAAVIFFVLEGHGLTLLVDDWSLGFSARTNFDTSAFLSDHNGHLVAVPVALTKASLQIFGADAALPLRLTTIVVQLATAACLFFLLRPAIGASGAVVPIVLVLFLGAANDVLIGSHGLPFTISVLAGLAAWLALRPQRFGWDIVAAASLTVGIASDGVALPFVFGAGVAIWLAGSPRGRFWVVALPLFLYGLWWLGYGGSESDFAIANLAGLPAFAFDSLAASLGSITGVFTAPGSRTGGFDLSAGQALAGASLVGLLVIAVVKGYRPRATTVPALVALLSFWILTAAVASPARQPLSSRYIYVGVVLVLLVVAYELGASPLRRQGAVALSAICAFALLPNIRELTYAADGARRESEINRAVMGAADLVEGYAPSGTLLEDPNDVIASQLPELGFSLEQYEESRDRFGVPAFSVAQIAATQPVVRAAADHFLARALAVQLRPAVKPPGRLPQVDATQIGGLLSRAGGCLRFRPLAAGAQLVLRLPVGGLWLRPAQGPDVQIGLRRFAEDFGALGVPAGPAVGGLASTLRLPAAGVASRGWHAQLVASQPILVCGA